MVPMESDEAMTRSPVSNIRQRGRYHEGSLSNERTVLKSESPPCRRIEAEGETTNNDSVEPPFKDRRHAIPPQRELDDNRVGPENFLLFSHDVFRKAA